MGKFRTLVVMMLCGSCLGAGCDVCDFTGSVASVETVPETERLPRVAVSEPFAALMHEAVFDHVPPGMLVDLAELASERGELSEEVLGEKIEGVLCRAEDFLSDLDESAALRGITSGQLLARMVLHGTCGPETPCAPPAPPAPAPAPSPVSPSARVIESLDPRRRGVECPGPCRRSVSCPSCEVLA